MGAGEYKPCYLGLWVISGAPCIRHEQENHFVMDKMSKTVEWRLHSRYFDVWVGFGFQTITFLKCNLQCTVSDFVPYDRILDMYPCTW